MPSVRNWNMTRSRYRPAVAAGLRAPVRWTGRQPGCAFYSAGTVRVLVLLAHPEPASFAAALAAAAVRGLGSAGHEVRVVDLYGEGFEPVMTTADRIAYDTDDAVVDDAVRAQTDHVLWAEALVFVYPTWWSGLPAVLKGWLDRVLVPGVAFRLDERTRKVTPALQHIRHLVGITTYGSKRSYVTLMGDGGRRTIGRALRMVCGWRTPTTWLALHRMDTRTDAERRAFLARVEERMARL
jgi:putative NADPH-quinone reductase